MSGKTNHPLFDRKLDVVEHWAQWKVRWEETSQSELLHSLLHFGFDVDVNAEEKSERLRFYLALADGHGYVGNYTSMSSREEYPQDKCGFARLSQGQRREKLASKAFDVLCMKLFKFETGCQQSHFYHSGLYEAENHKAVLDFLYGPKEFSYGKPRVKNLGRTSSRGSALMMTFIEYFIEYFWFRGIQADPAFQQYFPLYTRIYAETDMLRRLLPERQFRLQPTDSVLKTLEELALEYEFSKSGGPSGHAQSVKEAAAYGCKAAEILLLLRNERRHTQSVTR